MIMRAMTPARVETAFWLAICLALAAIVGVETDWGRHLKLPPYPIAEQPGTFVKPVLVEPYRLPAADTLLEMAMRPLFIVTRRPAPPSDVEAERPRMRKDQFILTGVSIVQQGKFAFLFEKAAKRTQVVSEGKQINGITVKTISADQVVLTQYDDSELLSLRTAKAPNVPAPSPVPARPPMAVLPAIDGARPPVAPARTASPPDSQAPAATPSSPAAPSSPKPQAPAPLPAKPVAGPAGR